MKPREKAVAKDRQARAKVNKMNMMMKFYTCLTCLTPSCISPRAGLRSRAVDSMRAGVVVAAVVETVCQVNFINLLTSSSRDDRIHPDFQIASASDADGAAFSCLSHGCAVARFMECRRFMVEPGWSDGGVCADEFGWRWRRRTGRGRGWSRWKT